MSGHHDILATINKFVDTNRLPHLLLYGPPGTGKTSTILALARRIYGSENMRQMVLELNASDDRGIDVVREQIKTFASTKQIFTVGSAASRTGVAGYKLIILDEADAMTNTAQMALRRIMEKYTANTRFCIIANYSHKLSPALLSRCTRFRFSPLKEQDIRVLVDKVIEEENVKITPDATESLVRLSKGDMRRALNVLQACHASSMFFFSSRPMFWRALADQSRHTTPPTRWPENPREGHCPRDHHDTDYLQLRCRAAPRRRQEDSQHTAQHKRRHVLPIDHQHAQGSPGAGACRHYHGAVGGAGQAGGEAPGHDRLAGDPRRRRAQGVKWRKRGDTNGGRGGGHPQRGRADGMKTSSMDDNGMRIIPEPKVPETRRVGAGAGHRQLGGFACRQQLDHRPCSTSVRTHPTNRSLIPVSTMPSVLIVFHLPLPESHRPTTTSTRAGHPI